jgi:deoxyribose-phosphate aldolase
LEFFLLKPEQIAAMIDHTILKPESVRSEIERVCREALEYGFASVCVNPCWVPLVSRAVVGSPVAVCSVIAFPFGATSTAAKVAESEIAIGEGARELDMVINIGALRSGESTVVGDDIAGVVSAAHGRGASVKVILETALLTESQIVTACQLAQQAGADFVKTSTGFASGGATVAAVALMRHTVGPVMGVKASGGIRTLEDFQKMVAAGASRIGASAGIQIVDASRA